ncbi:hypothetical protein PM033_17290 [Halorubrum ezzemoulense]|uniref:DUF6414 family protein n=1 Tax=Halorubrum ezzemoulense TaxID=337243 RepID=UPI0023313B73|nr:hypothetical protein [Halorubrum ezzemoulense]MDB2253478.1 hypothetical protein [Halorubrum ezzemoulense]
MTFFRVPNYWRHWHFGQASGEPSTDEGKQFPQLREFVYIDQRSVRSLLASTDSGRVASEQTSRESNINTTQNSANLGTGAGPVNIGAGTSRTSQQGNETENVYTFDLIQSKFTRLYEHEKITPEISLNPDGEYKIEDNLELSKLERGDVLEFRGTIRLHPLYRIYRAIEYIKTAVPDEADISEGDMQLIEESLGNKIPIEIEANELSIDENGDISENTQGDSFNIVALLDETELWTEPIQTLASSKQFRIFCRVESIRPNWYPMKLIRVLESISPNLAESFNKDLESELQAAMDRFEAQVEARNEKTGINEQKLREFTEFLAERADSSIEDDRIDNIVDHATSVFSPKESVTFEQEVELQKQAYDSFTEILSDDEFSEESASLRSEFHQSESPSRSEDSERDFTAHLEANVIGVYW